MIDARWATREGDVMELGNFSISLAVHDLRASSAFYRKLGFRIFRDESDQGWMVLKNSSCIIGLFQGMFDKNMLTFNPGWDANGKPLTNFDDIRIIQRKLRSAGLEPSGEAAETGTGPDSLMLIDPDGNPILVDQHVPAPGSG